MKKKAISILLGLCILTLAGCGIAATGMETVNTVVPEKIVEVSDRGGETTGAQKDTDKEDNGESNEKDTNGEDDNKNRPETDERDTGNPATDEEIEERIESAGKAYDGLVSYDSPSVDAILLSEEDLLSDSNRDYSARGREEKAAVEKYTDLLKKFRSHFRLIGVYEPKEGYTIAICGQKLYEYKLSDTDEILATYKEMQNAKRDLPVPEAEDYVSNSRSGHSSKGLLSGITGLISGKKSASVQTEMATAGATADVCYEESCEEAYVETEAAECMPEPEIDPFVTSEDWNTEEYKSFEENRFMSTQASPFSTFGMDVDTASFSNFRKKIFNGRDIPKDSIRTEEMMNYFDYDYVTPEEGEKFGITTEISDTPWNRDTKLLRVGVKSEEADTKNVSSNIVFLIDTSGSMFDPDKLPLVQKSFLMLLHNLDKNDRVSIVTYAGNDEVICEGIPCNKKELLTEKIVSLSAWGGTNGAAGITSAYEIAKKNFIKDGNNRVILATDGDLNIGLTSESDLVDLIREEKESGVFLSVLGVGAGNYKDSKMKALADNGNGNFAYIDSTTAADKALRKDFNSLVYTVAKDAKMQVEFNPALIKGYRQIGYELRQLNAEDFADDTKDGAEIGSGQCVTVLYEIVPVDSEMEIPGVSSKYANGNAGDDTTDELLTVSIRYKEPDADKSQLIEVPVTYQAYDEEMSQDLSWAAGVAEISQLLRDSEYMGTSDPYEVYERLKADRRIMQDDDRAQFLYMIKLLTSGTIEVTEEDDGYYW